MPAAFDRMVRKIWAAIKGKKNPRTGKLFTESDAYAIAVAQWKRTHGGRPPTRGEGLKDWRVLEFFVPIKETTSVGNDFFIKGIAINETTTRNGIKYIAKELEKAAPTFRNKPILLDHKNEVESIVGRTTENVSYSQEKKGIEFEAKIMDEKIQKMINDGRITDVSIGAKVSDLVQNKDENTVTAIGLEGLEISLVAVPGDPGANLASAMANNFMIKESVETAEDFLDKIEDFLDENIKEKSEEEEDMEVETIDIDDEIDDEVPYERFAKIGEQETKPGGGRSWSAVDKRKLPDSSFAWIEIVKGKRKAKLKRRHLPYKFADGTLSRRGVAAAWAAIHGARGARTKWPASAVAKIRAARKRLGMAKKGERFEFNLKIN
ncbi:MAG: HK97 family phage prohead protease [Candidatus Heimdallarchaeaceae archaeon]